MFKQFLIVLFIAFFSMGFSNNMEAPENECPEVTNVQRTSQAANSISFSWIGSTEATQYKVWFKRELDGYVSEAVTVSSISHTFSGLQTGSYTFYFQAICPVGPSNFIGIQDLVNG